MATIAQARETIVSTVVSGFPISWLHRATGTRLIVPYYHVVSDYNLSHVEHLYKYKTPRQFEDDLHFLLKHYQPLDLLDVLSRMKSGRPLPKRAFLLTFDDGYREIYDVVAPVLMRKGISATFFVNTAFIDNTELCYLNKVSILVEHLAKVRPTVERQLLALLRAHNIRCDNATAGLVSLKYAQRDLLAQLADVMRVDFNDYLIKHQPYLTSANINSLIKDGFTIGAHSIDHPLYSALSLTEQLRQTVESVVGVRQMFQLSYGVFAFPHSDHNVTKEFFDTLSSLGVVDLSFGTAGLIRDSAPNHIQRFSLEKPLHSAQRIIAFQYARQLRNLLKMSPAIIRS